jgi:phosphoribosylanthranilate isomerase
MTWIKICGITNIEDGLRAASLGVDALGFVFATSPRRVEPDVARKIIRAIPTPPLKVGVFVNEDLDEVLRLIDYCGLKVLQFHGEEPSEYCQAFSLPIIKALRIKDLESLKDMERYPETILLLDTYSPVQAGGTGNPFSWEIALKAKEKQNFILSGGLTQENIGEAISKVRPWGIDVSSGVEMVPGRKDHLKMNDFVKEVRRADEKTR